MKKTVSSLYEVPEIQVLRICAQDVLCVSTFFFGGGSNESIVDDSENGTNSWDWIY